MLCEIDNSFLFDDSSTNGMRPWENQEYMMTEGTQNSQKQIEQDTLIFKQAVMLIENQSEADSKYSPEIRQKIKEMAKIIYCELHQRYI